MHCSLLLMKVNIWNIIYRMSSNNNRGRLLEGDDHLSHGRWYPEYNQFSMSISSASSLNHHWITSHYISASSSRFITTEIPNKRKRKCREGRAGIIRGTAIIRGNTVTHNLSSCENNLGLNFFFQASISQLLKLCVKLRWSIMTSILLLSRTEQT